MTEDLNPQLLRQYLDASRRRVEDALQSDTESASLPDACLSPERIQQLVFSQSSHLDHWIQTHCNHCRSCQVETQTTQETLDALTAVVHLAWEEPMGAKLPQGYRWAAAPDKWDVLANIHKLPATRLPVVRYFTLSPFPSSPCSSVSLIILENSLLLFLAGDGAALDRWAQLNPFELYDDSQRIQILPTKTTELEQLFPTELAHPFPVRCYEVKECLGNLLQRNLKIPAVSLQSFHLSAIPAESIREPSAVTELIETSNTDRFLSHFDRHPSLLEDAATLAFYLHSLHRRHELNEEQQRALSEIPWLDEQFRLCHSPDLFAY